MVFGMLSVCNDRPGQKMEYTYDALGRQQTIRAPYEIERSATLSALSTSLQNQAHTIHYSKEGNIDTYTFAISRYVPSRQNGTGVVWSGGNKSKGLHRQWKGLLSTPFWT